MLSLVGAERLPGAQAPGRAAKIKKYAIFMKRPQKFGVIKDLSRPRKFSQRIESTQRMYSWICRDLPEVGKIAPESNEFTDFEQSLFSQPIRQEF